jgi:hypothetical protein
MQAPLESNFLISNNTFVLLLLVSLVVFGLFVLWPLVETVVRRQWGYLLGIVLFGPIGGLLWFLVGRRETAHQSQRNGPEGLAVAHVGGLHSQARP